MTPLQRIGLGMVVVVLPAYFPHDPHPAWRFYDALPDPVGWVLVLAGLAALRRRSDLDLDVARWLALAAFVVSVPLWLPQVNHLLVPEYDRHVTVSLQWFVGLPQSLFGLALCRTLSREALAQDPPDRFVAGRYGVLAWGFAAATLLPVVAYGGGVDALEAPTLVLIGLVEVAFCYQLFRVHRRPWLGGAAVAGPARTKAAPDEPERPSTAS